ARDESGTLQGVQVLRDCLPRDRGVDREPCQRRGTVLAELLDQTEAHGIGEREDHRSCCLQRAVHAVCSRYRASSLPWCSHPSALPSRRRVFTSLGSWSKPSSVIVT